jgi:transposase-like protein
MAMAWLVERLLLEPHGVLVEALREEVGRSPRSMRAWIQELREDYPGLRDARGRSLVELVGEADARRIRLRRDAAPAGVDPIVDLATELSARALEQLAGSGLARAGARLRRAHHDRLPQAARARLADPRKVLVHHPGAPDYWGRGRVLATLTEALRQPRRVLVTRTWSPAPLRIEPLSIVYAAGRIALIARAPLGSPELFELGDLVAVDLLDEPFDYPPPSAYDPAEVLSPQ